jgi:hypothetical protein
MATKCTRMVNSHILSSNPAVRYENSVQKVASALGNLVSIFRPLYELKVFEERVY